MHIPVAIAVSIIALFVKSLFTLLMNDSSVFSFLAEHHLEGSTPLAATICQNNFALVFVKKNQKKCT